MFFSSQSCYFFFSKLLFLVINKTNHGSYIEEFNTFKKDIFQLLRTYFTKFLYFTHNMVTGSILMT